MTHDEIVAELEAAGRELEAADTARAAALARMKAAMLEGDKDQLVDVKTMAAAAGVSRVTTYRLLGRTKVGDR
ncbi:hypothetical protein Back2_17730 [Nocardioides baekrokdamisoli]|uniref:Uncharacterized protein n=1 Tax=Nocardioides baekrokdamisoli TaxID=1804624 RepID=A0A3G9IGM8_9ACTN|nr:hypothetical protein [Nocardioides baekrokdamisoli]BBH17486.1 hypothetical protein Back2_17730 [Nocardioides baekrokdamisoli]